MNVISQFIVVRNTFENYLKCYLNTIFELEYQSNTFTKYLKYFEVPEIKKK